MLNFQDANGVNAKEPHIPTILLYIVNNILINLKK